ncbi:MAG: IPT/TIG domain-containing protein, partial [Bacillota bacterium]
MIRAVRFISIVLVLFASLFGAPIVHAANCTGTGQLSISMAPCPASTFVKFGTSGSISSVATLQGSIPGEVYIEALPSTAIFSTSGFSANFISANRLQVTFYTLSTNSTGVHTGSIDLKICSDPHCRDVLTETQLLYKVSVVVPPTVLQLSPGSVKVGASAFTLKLLGGGFASGSVIHFGDKALTTKFISGSELTARVDLSSATSGHSYKVWVVPPPGNFASNVVLFRLLNPVPSAAQVSPATAMFGVISVPFTVTGTGFVPGSRILFNGTIWPTTFVSKTELMATVDFAEIFPTLVGGIYNVTVQSPAPGGGTSGNLTFTLNNYTPAITSLSPSSEPIVAFGEIVMINGSGFQFNSVVQLNGVTFSSAYISPTQLELELPGNAFTTGADLPVTVTNPSPGGGTSNSAILEIDNPAPSLHWISPVQAYAGSGDMVLTVRASNLNSATQLE